MNNKRTWIEKLGDFISGKGFYLVVLICVAAIALSGYYLVQGVRGGLGEVLDQPASGSAAIVEPPSAAPTARPSASPTAPPAAASARITAAPASAAPAPSAEPEPEPSTAPAPAPLVFTWPVKGTVIAGFSVEALAYNETMGDWRTHNGLDIAASQGTQVLAAANGTVAAVETDALLGATVTVNHTGGLMSVYGNLDPDTVSVAVGDPVDTGMILGCVGSSATGERNTGAWLHFSVLQDGVPIDPETYLQ